MRRPNDNAKCADCRFCLRDRAEMEQAFSGLSSLGSAFGASISDAGLCLRHDRLVSPNDICQAYEPKCLATAKPR